MQNRTWRRLELSHHQNLIFQASQETQLAACSLGIDPQWHSAQRKEVFAVGCRDSPSSSGSQAGSEHLAAGRCLLPSPVAFLPQPAAVGPGHGLFHVFEFRDGRHPALDPVTGFSLGKFRDPRLVRAANHDPHALDRDSRHVRSTRHSSA